MLTFQGEGSERKSLSCHRLLAVFPAVENHTQDLPLPLTRFCRIFFPMAHFRKDSQHLSKMEKFLNSRCYLREKFNRGVLQKRYSKKFGKIYRKTTVLEFLNGFFILILPKKNPEFYYKYRKKILLLGFYI